MVASLIFLILQPYWLTLKDLPYLFDQWPFPRCPSTFPSMTGLFYRVWSVLLCGWNILIFASWFLETVHFFDVQWLLIHLLSGLSRVQGTSKRVFPDFLRYELYIFFLFWLIEIKKFFLLKKNYQKIKNGYTLVQLNLIRKI